MANRVSTLRVLSGKLKGKKLESPRSELTHPMGAREKLALFNMVQPYLADAKVLDAYAGSGAVGVEAISLGARELTFVEKSPRIAATLHRNLSSVGVNAAIFTEPVTKFAARAEFREYFDLIIADPPYDKFEVREVIELGHLLRNGGVLTLSFPARLDAPAIPGLKLLKSRSYAAAGIALYRRGTSD